MATKFDEIDGNCPAHARFRISGAEADNAIAAVGLGLRVRAVSVC
jgi:hypothetical protein